MNIPAIYHETSATIPVALCGKALPQLTLQWWEATRPQWPNHIEKKDARELIQGADLVQDSILRKIWQYILDFTLLGEIETLQTSTDPG